MFICRKMPIKQPAVAEYSCTGDCDKRPWPATSKVWITAINKDVSLPWPRVESIAHELMDHIVLDFLLFCIFHVPFRRWKTAMHSCLKISPPLSLGLPQSDCPFLIGNHYEIAREGQGLTKARERIDPTYRMRPVRGALPLKNRKWLESHVTRVQNPWNRRGESSCDE